MPKRYLLAGMALLVATAATALPAAAQKELNQRQHLDPRMNSKVQSHKAQAWRQAAGDQAQVPGQPGAGCGSQSVGNVVTGPGGRTPREVTTIITGDVVNVVGPGGCR